MQTGSQRLGPPVDPRAAFAALLASPMIASKRWAYPAIRSHGRDQHHRAARRLGGRRARQGHDARLAVSVDCNGRFCYLDPYRGAMLAVAESARNVACAGAEPIGATNNLNFGNPERPEIMWQLAEAVRGIGDACRALDIPITGRQRQPLQRDRRRGDLPDAGPRRRRAARRRVEDGHPAVQADGASVVLLGENRGELGGSEYLARCTIASPALRRPRSCAERLQRWSCVQSSAIESAHDCAEGGLAVALAECCFDTPFGVSPICQRCGDVPQAFR